MVIPSGRPLVQAPKTTSSRFGSFGTHGTPDVSKSGNNIKRRVPSQQFYLCVHERSITIDEVISSYKFLWRLIRKTHNYYQYSSTYPVYCKLPDLISDLSPKSYSGRHILWTIFSSLSGHTRRKVIPLSLPQKSHNK